MKKAGILILILVIAGVGGLFVHHRITIPKEEGVARLRASEINLFSDLVAYASPYTLGEKIKPEELLDVPAGISDSEIFYFTLPIGKKEVFALVQKPHPDRAIAWIDQDMDKHLADEKALTGVLKKHSEDGQTWNYFSFGKIQVIGENTTAAFHLLVDEDIYYTNIQPIRYVKGKIQLGGQLYRVAVIDGDYDGKFNTCYEPSADNNNYGYNKCDTILLETSHGLFSSYDPGKIVPVGQYYKFSRDRYYNALPNGTEGYYTITLSEDGKTLRMQRGEPEMGTLKIGADKQLSLRLFSDTATQEVNFRDAVEIPAGCYQIYYGQLTYMPENRRGFETTVDFRDDIRKGLFEIKPGQTVTLNPGPPFRVKTYVNGGSDNRISINAGLLGNEGETCGLRISRSMPRPVLKILDENGMEIHSDTMEYG